MEGRGKNTGNIPSVKLNKEGKKGHLGKQQACSLIDRRINKKQEGGKYIETPSRESKGEKNCKALKKCAYWFPPSYRLYSIHSCETMDSEKERSSIGRIQRLMASALIAGPEKRDYIPGRGLESRTANSPG